MGRPIFKGKQFRYSPGSCCCEVGCVGVSKIHMLSETEH